MAPQRRSNRIAASALLASALVAGAHARALNSPGFDNLCPMPAAYGRLDPIITPGALAGHVHVFYGATNVLSNSTTYEDTQLPSTCTSCQFGVDKSLYWMPALYHKDNATGMLTMVEARESRIYFQPRTTAYDKYRMQEFPPGHQMIAGDPTAKGPSGIGNIDWQCTDFLAGNPQFTNRRILSTSYRFPSSTKCDFWVARVVFPNCWNGRQMNRLRPYDHMRYPVFNTAIAGKCPDTHPYRFLTLNFWVAFQISQRFGNADPSEFMLSTGDTKGYSLHADFLNGWVPGNLQQAIYSPGHAPLPSTVQNIWQMNTCNAKLQDSQLPDERISYVMELPGAPTTFLAASNTPEPPASAAVTAQDVSADIPQWQIGADLVDNSTTGTGLYQPAV